MAKTVIFILLIVLHTWKMSVEARPGPSCPICPIGGCPLPTNCNHGVILDNCGIGTCAKGPGQRCRVKRLRQNIGFPNGNCGDGMYCHCGLCMGCSLHTYQCFEDTCVFPMGSR